MQEENQANQGEFETKAAEVLDNVPDNHSDGDDANNYCDSDSDLSMDDAVPLLQPARQQQQRSCQHDSKDKVQDRLNTSQQTDSSTGASPSNASGNKRHDLERSSSSLTPASSNASAAYPPDSAVTTSDATSGAQAAAAGDVHVGVDSRVAGAAVATTTSHGQHDSGKSRFIFLISSKQRLHARYTYKFYSRTQADNVVYMTSECKSQVRHKITSKPF